MGKQLNLEEIVLIGRTFDEYCRMFDLTERDLSGGRILDAASGVSSFCAESNTRGYQVTAADRIYVFRPGEIREKCVRDLEMVVGQLPGIMDLYVWDYFPDISALKEQRKKAYETFIQDFDEFGTARYIPTEFPASGFADGEFSLALASHFLFLYDEHLDYGFHKETLLELLRIVSKEVRVFPLVNLKGERSRWLDPVLEDADFAAFRMEIRRVGYEFIKGGNEMLLITKR